MEIFFLVFSILFDFGICFFDVKNTYIEKSRKPKNITCSEIFHFLNFVFFFLVFFQVCSKYIKEYNVVPQNDAGEVINKTDNFVDCVNTCETETTCHTATYFKNNKDCRRIKFGYYTGQDSAINTSSIATIVNPSNLSISIGVFSRILMNVKICKVAQTGLVRGIMLCPRVTLVI